MKKVAIIVHRVKVDLMKKLRSWTSLSLLDDGYQIAQACSVHEAAPRIGLELQLVYAENDSIASGRQLLEGILATDESKLDSINSADSNDVGREAI